MKTKELTAICDAVEMIENGQAQEGIELLKNLVVESLSPKKAKQLNELHEGAIEQGSNVTDFYDFVASTYLV